MNLADNALRARRMKKSSGVIPIYLKSVISNPEIEYEAIVFFIPYP